MNKKELIKNIVDDKRSDSFRNFYKLFECLLNEARMMNDIAPILEVPKIKGEIRVLKKLLKDLNPNFKVVKRYDGGYGS